MLKYKNLKVYKGFYYYKIRFKLKMRYLVSRFNVFLSVFEVIISF